MLWPGLNAPIMQGRDVVKRRQLPPNPEYQEQLVKIRDELSKVKYPKLAPLERGWSGNRFPGQSIGPPEPFGDCEYISPSADRANIVVSRTFYCIKLSVYQFITISSIWKLLFVT